jgi:uncharacterized protein (TIGR00303 family)
MRGSEGRRALTPASPAAAGDGQVTFPCAAGEGQRLAAELAGKRPLFVCVIASTDTAQIPGISAAGASTELIPFTAAADAEFIVHGEARCIKGVPSNPLGPPGPALITRAALELAHISRVIVNAGCRIPPDAPAIAVGATPGYLISERDAVPDAARLFESGRDLGRRLASEHDYLVVAESVPGGTTTALALLLALGYQAHGRISSSLGGNAHGLKSAVAERALQRLAGRPGAGDPLGAVAVLGDPMQPTAAGIAMGSMEAGKPVLLAGGTQMVAVLALLTRLYGAGPSRTFADCMAIATTRWVVEDPTSDIIGLQRDVGPVPLLATSLSFASSRHASLRRYEDNLVKEGVGAGGAAVAAHLTQGITTETLTELVEALVDRLQALAPNVPEQATPRSAPDPAQSPRTPRQRAPAP